MPDRKAFYFDLAMLLAIVVVGMIAGSCTTTARKLALESEFNAGYAEAKYMLSRCLEQQTSEYSDLCAEESSGYEEMSPGDAHFHGVKCAVETINICMGVTE